MTMRLNEIAKVFRRPSEAAIDPTDEEHEEWNRIAPPYIRGIYARSLSAAALGWGVGWVVLQFIDPSGGFTPPVSYYWGVFSAILVGVVGMLGANGMVTVKKKEMIRSLRLRRAMEQLDSDGAMGSSMVADS
jgi:hypothetical protein